MSVLLFLIGATAVAAVVFLFIGKCIADLIIWWVDHA